jgi:uncharacterized protein YyaL (SSP411 family)
MPNRLAHESSPYLLQHANNPVDWYPWGAEALERSRREDKPIFLSIGYSACHWCHVMEHESFESDPIAVRLNECFVCIKVDREERPDLDQIYMNAVQLITGRGGWPMSVFLTPDLEPFYGGTYWPPESRHGLPGFPQVIEAVAEAWANRREQAVAQARELTSHLQTIGVPAAPDQELSPELLTQAAGKLEQSFDFAHGGFGGAPKFPHPIDLQFLLRVWHRTQLDGLLDMVRLNLDKMARGGIYDHLAGGFARYSVDERWLVPHFEKMLYDNGLLAGAYLDAYLATGHEPYARVARETLDYVLRDMTDPAGGFYSSEDADSEGEEGRFYVWTPEEIEAALGNEAGQRFAYVYGVSPEGNFEGRNILHLPKTIAQCAALRGWDLSSLEVELAESRRRLLAIRNERIRPGRDDKVLVSWNALAIDSLARTGAALDEPTYVTAAENAARFILDEMRQPNGRLWHAWRNGQAKFAAYLDDYTYLIQALVSLYEATFDEQWVDRAVELAEIVVCHFSDTDQGGFFYTADDHEQLIARNKDYFDSSVPSGNAMAATALTRLNALTGAEKYREAARQTLHSATGLLKRASTAAGQMLIALDLELGPRTEIVLIGDPNELEVAEVLKEIRRRYLPSCAVALRSLQTLHLGSNHLTSLFAGKEATEPSPTLFLCQNFTCQAPLAGKAAIRAGLDQQFPGPRPSQS